MPWRCQVLRLGWISCCRSGGCTPASHQRVDEIHEELQEQLTPLGVTISRREILYLFEAYCTLLRASSEVQDDQEWLS
jgi:hypothetical protein